MIAFNVVRFKVKPGMDETFLDAHRKVVADWPGMRHANIIKTDDQRYCIIAEWESMEALAASRPQGFEKILLEKLQADDFAVRAAAATALGELNPAAAVPALLEAYKISLGDLAYSARDALLTAINAIEPATGRQLLEQALRD